MMANSSEVLAFGLGSKAKSKWPIRSAEVAVEISTFARLIPSSPPRGWISPEAAGRLFQVINFNQTYPHSIIFPRKNSGVSTRGDGHNHGRLKVIRRCKPCCLNIRLLRVFPIIVSFYDD